MTTVTSNTIPIDTTKSVSDEKEPETLISIVVKLKEMLRHHETEAARLRAMITAAGELTPAGEIATAQDVSFWLRLFNRCNCTDWLRLATCPVHGTPAPANKPYDEISSLCAN